MTPNQRDNYLNDALELLRQLIATPSFSKEEKQAADILEGYLARRGLHPHREGNNVWVMSGIDQKRPTLLLNAHIDTVRPVDSWTRDPLSLL